MMNLMTMKTLLLPSVLVMAYAAASVMAVKLDCEFGMVSHTSTDDTLYTCTTRDLNVVDDNEIVESNVIEMQRQHLSDENMTNNDVKALIIEHQKVISMPNGLAQIFPNLQLIVINHSGMRAIKADNFKGLAALRVLDLSHNQIEELDDGIFTDNQFLEVVSFKSNEIKIIARSIFENLRMLRSVSFSANECIDSEWTSENFDEMRKQIVEQCSSATDDMEAMPDTTAAQQYGPPAAEAEMIFNLSCSSIVEKYWDFSERDFLTCSIVDDNIENSNYFLSMASEAAEKFQALEISTKESKFLPQNLHTLPDLVELSAQNTRLESISGMLFTKSASLKRINLAGNEISVIERQTFVGLSRLVELDLSEGEIRFIEEEAFVGLDALLLLNLGGNMLNYLAPGVFGALTSLQYLSLELNHLTYLNKGALRRNTELINIWLNGNKISSLSAALFSSLEKLQLVDLQKNECIDKIFEASNMGDLASELDDNCDSTGVEEIITETVRRKIRKFRNMKKIINYSEDEDEIHDQYDIDSYSSSSLSEIIQNVMIIIPPVQTNDSSTQHAANATNQQQPEDDNTTAEPNLKAVTCQFDEIHWTHVNRKLKTCIINNQIIDSPDYVIVPQTRDDEVQGFAVVDSLEVKFLPDNIGEVFPNLVYILAQNSSIGHLKEETFVGLQKLASLSLANNRLRSIIPETFSDLRELEELDLSHNRMELIDETLFERLSKLKVLRLEGNQIHYIHPKLLRPLRSLQNISISNNHLTILDDNVFDAGRHKSLKNVWLHSNRLRRLTPKLFAGLAQLEYVDLTENKCIDESFNRTRFEAMNDEISRKCAANEYVLKKKTLSQFKKHENDNDIIQCSKIVEMFWDALHENLMTCVVDSTTMLDGEAEADVRFDSSTNGSNVGALLISGNEKIKFLPSNIAAIFPSLLVINADGDGIEELGENTFKSLTTLKVLSLKSNNMTRIAPGAFDDLSSLQQLDLSDNGMEEFAANATTFHRLGKLENLSLSGNDFKIFHSQLVDGMEELAALSIGRVENAVDLSVLFHQHPKLRTVTIDGKVFDRNSIFASTSSNDVECEISYGNDGNVACRLFPNSSLENPNVRLHAMPAQQQHLKVKQFIIEANENVEFLPENLSEVFPQLEEISITQTGLAHVGEALKGLEHLKRLNLSRNRIQSISTEAFNGLESLNVLDLRGNFIENMAGNSFDNLQSLQKLLLSNNKISTLNDEQQNLFAKLRNLNVVKLDGNLLSVIGAKIFENNPQLIEIDLSRNALVVIEPGAFGHLERVKTINLRSNKCIDEDFDAVAMDEMLRSLEDKCTKGKIARKIILNCDDENDSDAAAGEQKRRSCTIDQEIDHDNLPDDAAAFHVNGSMDDNNFDPTSLGHLTLQGRKIKFLPARLLSVFTNLTKLTVLNTAVKNFEIDFFKGMPQLSEVKLSGNIISRIIASNSNMLLHNGVDGEKNEKFFHRNLKILDLSDNRIEDIEQESFESLTMLEKLSLSHNSIRSIHGKLFEKLRNLNEVSLDNNLLSIIEMKTFVNNRRLSEIDLTGNSIETVVLLGPVDEDVLQDKLMSSLRRIKLRGNKCIDEDFDLDNEHVSVDVVVRRLADKCTKTTTQLKLIANKVDVECNESNYEMKSCSIVLPSIESHGIENHEIHLTINEKQQRLRPDEIETLEIHGGSLPQNLGELFPNLRDLLIKNPSLESLSKGGEGGRKFANMKKLKMLRLEGIESARELALDELENLDGLEVVGSFDEFDGAILSKLKQLRKLKITSKDLKTFSHLVLPGRLEDLELQSAPNGGLPASQQMILVENNPQLLRLIVNGEDVIETIKSQITTPSPTITEKNIQENVKCYFEHWRWTSDGNPLITCSINQATLWDNRTVIAPTSYDNHTRGLRIENNKNLKFIPKNLSKFLPNLWRISLRNSSIDSIAEHDFDDGWKHVRSLDLSKNEISIVQPDHFKMLESLVELDLSDNKIVAIDEKLLEGMRNMRVLNLKNNNLTSLNFLKRPNKLERVFINGNHDVTREDFFEVGKFNPSLQLFDDVFIQQKKGSRCSVENVTWTYPCRTILTCKIEGSLADTNDFVHDVDNDLDALVEGLSVTDNEQVKLLPHHLGTLFPNLIVILASNNGILRLSPENFDVVPKLKFLNLARNYIDHIDPETFVGAQNLEDFDLSFNRIDELDESTFKYLRKLKSIYLSSNLLQEIPSKIFENLGDLRNVSLENNRLRSIDRDLFGKNVRLSNIWLNGNQLRIIDPRAFAALRPDYIDLRENDCINKFFDENDLMNLKDNILHFCQNIVAVVTTTRGSNGAALSHVSKIPQQQRENNELVCKIDAREATAPAEGKFYVCTIDGQPAGAADVVRRISKSKYDPLIEIIIFDNNKHLHALPVDLGKQLPRLRVLSAKNGALSSLHASNFTDMVNIKLLDLSHNGIEKILSQTFVQLPNLDDLLLSRNRIEQIEAGAFPATLRILHLDGNRLKTLDTAMLGGMKHLQKLHLQSNQLERMSSGVFDDNRYLEEVSLAGNRIRVLSATAFDNLLNLRLVDLEENDCISGVFNVKSFKAMKHKIRMSCVEPLTPLPLAEHHHHHLQHHVPPHKVHPNEFVDENLLAPSITAPCEYASSFSTTLDKFLETCTIAEPIYTSDTVVEASPNNRRVKRLALTNRETLSLPNELANELPELEEITATNLEIESISPGNFQNLTKLKSIIMFGNNLRLLSPEAFAELPALETLDLSNNQLKHFHDHNIFSLRNLNLESNQLRVLTSDSLHLLPSLELLNLNNNRIFLIESDAFAASPRLKRIILSNNEISKIESNAFSTRLLGELELLDVSGNECINEIFKNFSSHDGARVKTIVERKCGSSSSCANVRKSLDVCRRNVNSMRKSRVDGAGEKVRKKLESDLRKSQTKVAMLNERIRKFEADHQQQGGERVLSQQYENQLNMISIENVKLRERLKFCSTTTTPSPSRHHLIVKHEESLSSPFVEINCKFSMKKKETSDGEEEGAEEYSCEVVDFTSLHDNSTLDEVKGNHKRGKRNSDVSSLLISEQNVRYLPKGAARLLPNLRRVEIADSNLRRVGGGELEGDIVEIIITGNHIYSIETGSFDALERLEMLDLSNNMIPDLPAKLLERNARLVRVNLSGNNLKELSGDVVPILARNRIRHFNVSHNKLREIDPNIVRRLMNAQLIDFTANDCLSSKSDAIVDGTNDDGSRVRLLAEIMLNCQRESADGGKDDWKFCKLSQA